MVEIRGAGTGDAERLAEIQVAAALRGYADIFPPDAPKPTAASLAPSWVLSVEAEESDVLVAELDGAVAGGVVLAREVERARLSRLYVDPDRWSIGIGGLLLDEAVALARRWDVPAVVLWVLEANLRARAWYERRGWRPTGRGRPAHGDIGETEYRLALPRRLADRPLSEPHPARLPHDTPRRDEVLARHTAALEARDPGYEDPETGLFVFTAGHLAGRGYCCDTGCRHCPYLAG